MSIEAVAWALGHAPVLNAQEHVILIALADRAHDDGRAAWPSRTWLAKRGRCSVRTVQRHLNAMEKRGLIRRGDSRMVAHLSADKRPTVWNLAMEMRAEATAPATPSDDPEPDFEPAPEPDSGEFERGDNLSHGSFGADGGDNQGSAAGGQIVPGDTAMAPRGVTQLWHTNHPLEPSFKGEDKDGGSFTGERHLAPEDNSCIAPIRSCADHDRPRTDCSACQTARRKYNREHLGHDVAPSPYCDRHPGGTADPCGPCKSARTDRVVWDAQHAARVAKHNELEVRFAAELRAAEIANCAMCDGDGYQGKHLCDHNPGQVETNLRGRALCDAVLAKKQAS